MIIDRRTVGLGLLRIDEWTNGRRMGSATGWHLFVCVAYRGGDAISLLLIAVIQYFLPTRRRRRRNFGVHVHFV